MKVQEVGDIYIIKLTGRIEGREEQLVEEELEYLCRLEKPRIIIDLTGVFFISSKFLGMIYSSKRKIQGIGDIRVVVNTQPVEEIFKITMLDKVFDIYDTIDDAINSYYLDEESV